MASGRSRMPAFERDIDEIAGVVYAQDLMRVLESGDQLDSIRPLLREAVFVPRSALIDDVLHELQRRQVQLAVILDEFGGTAGIVTVEDVLEEVVGEDPG